MSDVLIIGGGVIGCGIARALATRGATVTLVDPRSVGGGASRIEGPTFASFPLDQVGPPPWRVHVKLAGVAPTTILVGGPQ